MKNSNLKKKDLDWPNLGFGYVKTDYRFSAIYKDGEWSEGGLIKDEIIRLHEGSACIHYAQQCFEGMKAQTAKDGGVLLFRPEENAQRMTNTADRLLMPPVPKELFFKGVEEAVRANYAWIPPYGSGSALYIRPLLIGVGEGMGVKPAPQYEFRVMVTPVGPYYKAGGLSLISLAITGYDRAAPQGTGHVKAGANYAGGLESSQHARALGANEALYLDAKEKKYLDEAGSANIIVAMTNNRFVTPKSDSILPSITRRSVMVLAKEELKLDIEERPIDFFGEISDFVEVAACGTAAVISPIGKIWAKDKWFSFYKEGKEVGPIITQLYNSLTQIQRGEKEDTYGWTKEIEIS